mgnify:CR=1 FL=1
MRDKELAGLAHTLSRDLGMSITVGGQNSSCSADGQHINIARMPATPLGQQLMTGLVFHELGHQRYTTADKPPGFVGELTNVIEDIRTEKLTMQWRPGTRYDLDAVVAYYAKQIHRPPISCSEAVLLFVLAAGR